MPAIIAPVPIYDIDFFSDETILDPYPHYAAMRELGPLVYLPRHELYAIPRYADVKKALLAHNKLISGNGIAGFQWPPEINVRNTISSDGATHTRFRQVMGTPLQPSALAGLTAQIEIVADDLVRQLIQKGEFDGIADFARHLPVSIISSLVGLPEEGRGKMLDWAAASFDVLGVDNERSRVAMPEVFDMIHYVQTQCTPDTVRPGSWAAQLWQAASQGRLTPAEAGILHVDILAPALDTTIFATGHLLHELGKNPDQWSVLKADPSLISAAIDEAVRLESPIRSFARVATEDIDIDGTTLPAGGRVLVMYSSANRDERRWQDPERFWIERPGLNGHLGFGQGHHTCAGMHIAKLEMRSLLKSMLARVEHIEVGQPVYRVNNVLRGFASLPARFIGA
jgi:cytochrome P450